MSLSRLLSKPPAKDYQQIDTFWHSQENEDYEYYNEKEDEAPLPVGKNIVLNIGQVSKNYYCADCEDIRTFNSMKDQELRAIVVSQQMVSIDCVLWCICGSTVQVWFLVESEYDIRNQSPGVRILHFREKLSDNVKSPLHTEHCGEFAEWLEKANQAHQDGLGAGSVIYLRKIFESITYNIAKSIYSVKYVSIFR